MKKMFLNFAKKWQSLMVILTVIISISSVAYAFAMSSVNEDFRKQDIIDTLNKQKELNKSYEETHKTHEKKIEEINKKLCEKIDVIQINTAEIKGNMDIVIRMLREKSPTTQPLK